MSEIKAFDIPKALVWAAYKDVKRSGGGPGVDGQTMGDFERDLKNQLYRIWNRMSSGSYFPPPVLRAEIPKHDGGKRMLGIPTISDRIAQAVARRFLEPVMEPRFHEDSYGYRPGRSALDAVAKARQRCWQAEWVLDLDIKNFFDSLDHDLLMRAVRRFTSCRWVLLYIERWLKAGTQLQDGTVETRCAGTPQGGVISPLLANVFLHLAFDRWMDERFPAVRFERYADDVVVHCRSRQEVELVKREVERRLTKCKLELNPAKTRVVYCKGTGRKSDWPTQSFEFLGYMFRPRSVRNYRGEFFVSFSPAISPRAASALRQKIRRDWQLTNRTHVDLNSLARRLNPIISGWINYYGRFCRSALHCVLDHINTALAAWAKRKFKRLRGRRTRAHDWVKLLAKREPSLFVHWKHQGWMTRAV